MYEVRHIGNGVRFNNIFRLHAAILLTNTPQFGIHLINTFGAGPPTPAGADRCW